MLCQCVDGSFKSLIREVLATLAKCHIVLLYVSQSPESYSTAEAKSGATLQHRLGALSLNVGLWFGGVLRYSMFTYELFLMRGIRRSTEDLPAPGRLWNLFAAAACPSTKLNDKDSDILSLCARLCVSTRSLLDIRNVLKLQT